MTNLIPSNLEKTLGLSCFLNNMKYQNLSKQEKKSISTKVSTNYHTKKLAPWAGKWYFYFPSSDSDIVFHRKKTLIKNTYNTPDEAELNELYDLYSEDHIFGGTIDIKKEDDQYLIRLRYLTNPDSQTILTDVTFKDVLYLEALLRLHSIAPWYSKVKSIKINFLKFFDNSK